MLEVESILEEKLYVKNMGRTAEKFELLDKIPKFLRIIYS